MLFTRGIKLHNEGEKINFANNEDLFEGGKS